jgi:hypothetical protein
MTERLTPKEARGIDLPANPIKRLGQLAELGEGLEHDGLILTRRGLVKAAEQTKEIDEHTDWLDEVRQQPDFTQEEGDTNGKDF